MINIDHIPYLAEFLKWTFPAFSFETVHYNLWEYQVENLASKQQRVWSDFRDVQKLWNTCSS